MKLYLFVLIIGGSLYVSAEIHEVLLEGRVNGENGWYIPQMDGTSKWMDLLTAEEALNEENRLLNTVTFYLYTRRNPSAGQIIRPTTESINASNYRAENPTRFTIHGWNSNYRDGVNSGVRRAWFGRGDYNMIAVDWSRGRSLEYASSVAAVPATGRKIANMIDFLVKNYNLSVSTDLEVVGHSLGAHVAGHSAKNVKSGQVYKVIGLDPAQPLISYNKPEKRLSSDDAFYVETIQTAGGTLGFKQPIGKATFYPNGGRWQPGCGYDFNGNCAHSRAVTYYVESLELNNFSSICCDSYKDAHKDNCGSTLSNIRMGDDQNSRKANGTFYVPLNCKSPFGIGDLNSTTFSKDKALPTTNLFNMMSRKSIESLPIQKL